MTRSSVDLPAPLGPVSAIRSGPRIRQVNAVVREELSPTAADLKAFAAQHRAARGHVGVGQVEHDRVVVAQRTFGVVELRPRLVHPLGVHVVGPARRLLCVPLQLARDDLRQPGVLDVARGGARPACGALAGLLPLPLLALQLLLGVAQVRLRDLLRLLHRLLVHGEIASVEQHFAAIQLGDAVHPVEQHAVVADQQQASRVVVERVVEPVPRVDVEVVGRLVEQQHVGSLQQLRGQPERHHFATGQRAQPSVKARCGRGRAGRVGRECAPRCPSRRRSRRRRPRRRRRRPARRARRATGATPSTSATVRSATNGSVCGR